MDKLKDPLKNKFDRLPDDIVLVIFNKLWDAKWLPRCSIVSKRFSSIVPHINNVCVKLEQKDVTCCIFNYLVGLKELRYLHIEEDFLSKVDWINSWTSPLVKWKFNFDANVKSFTFLMTSFLIDMELPQALDEEDGEGVDEEEEENGEEIQHAMNARLAEELYRVDMALGCFGDVCMKLNMVLDMMGEHQMLESITITDIENQGKIIVPSYQIAELRHSERVTLSMLKVDRGVVKCCDLPSLHLPKSKLVMVRPTLVYIRCVDPSCHEESNDVIDEDMLANSFEGDEGGLYSEAVKEIQTKHKDKMSTVVKFWPRGG